ncbi:MAG: hypothetical protein NTV43_13955 [Methylococcales bacterium]|nr:hypothetical protein [Methylococcales bacterium]
MNDIKLQKTSIYFLMRELLYNGKAGLDENIEPMFLEDIQVQLANKSGTNFGNDKHKWVTWFINDYPDATTIEKNSITVTFRLLEAENKFLPRIKSRRDD